MTQAYLDLPLNDQAEILSVLAGRLGRHPMVLEKDIWVCWVLHQLFSLPQTMQMAFKGGTTLSKVYRAIHRFSEDIDVTIDFRSLDRRLEPFASPLSSGQRKALNENLRKLLKQYVLETVKPHFEQLAQQLHSLRLEVTVDDTGEKVNIRYPSALDNSQGGYIRESVLIEFGGRNTTIPSTSVVITPDIATELPELSFQSATPNVLAGERTFWEKATLIHAECNREQSRPNLERSSRHWYDLAMLADHPVGLRAISDSALLESVVEHKKVFYYSATANYDSCLIGSLRLVPSEGLLAQLQKDYLAMEASGMFYGTPPAFEDVIQRLLKLEKEINKTIG